MLPCLEPSKVAHEDEDLGTSWDKNLSDRSISVRKVRREKDPRTVAPSSLTNEIISLKHPFLDVHLDMRYMKGEDKCGFPLRMNYEVLQAFILHLGPKLQALYKSFATNGDELKTRPIHAGLLSEIFTLSNALTILRERQKQKEREKIAEEKKEKVKEDKENEEKKEDLEGITIDLSCDGENLVHVQSIDSREGMNLQHEMWMGSSGSADFMLRGYDKKYIKDNNLHPGDKRALCTYAVIEPKGPSIEEVWSNGPGGAFQAADYALGELEENLKKGRRSPIYLQSWSKDKWMYGVLEFHDVVELSEKGEVVGRSELQAKFNARKFELKTYMNDKTAKYDADKYLVATLHVSDEVLSFPYTERSVEDQLRFYHALLRLCLGERVLKLKIEDVQEMFEIVEDEIKKIQRNIKRKFLSNEEYEELCVSKRTRYS